VCDCIGPTITKPWAARKWTVPQEAEERLAIFERKTPSIIFGPVYGNNFG